MNEAEREVAIRRWEAAMDMLRIGVAHTCRECGSSRVRESIYRTLDGCYFVDLICDQCGYVDIDEEGGV